MMSIETLRDTVRRLNMSASALAALAAALDARVSGKALEPAIRNHVEEVVGTLELGDALEQATTLELRPLLGEIRTFALTNRKLLLPSSPGVGWDHHDPQLLIAAGEVAAALPTAFTRVIAPRLDGIVERLSRPGAAFLNVGVGVAILAIEMARAWPLLRVVGIDPWAPALALAREHVRAAELDDRIELREQRGEELADREAFDLAWIPSIFIPEPAISAVVERVHGALREGGWLLFPMFHAQAEGLAGPLACLRAALFGGRATTPAHVESMLRASGFAEVHALPSPPGSLSMMMVGRRAAPL